MRSERADFHRSHGSVFPAAMSEGGEVVEQGGVPRRARYLHPLAHYVPLIKRSERALKGWIAIGRDASPPDLPPFDDLPRMKDWWARRMSQRVPDDIAALGAVPVAAAGSAPVAPPVDAATGPLFAQAAAAPAVATPVISPAAPAVPGAVGYSAALQRIRAAEAAAGDHYTSLLRLAGDATKPAAERASLADAAEQARRVWDELGEKLRRYEKDAENILAASGRMWSAADVVAVNELVHRALRESIFGLLRRVRPKLAGKTIEEQDAVWQEEVERMLAVLRENKFTAAALPDAAD